MANVIDDRGDRRIGELDVLRGFALLGVFIVHFVGAAFYDLPMPETQRDLWQADPLQKAVLLASDLFFYDKANTLFATLFGMGFWLMLSRLSARDVPFERIYLRRLAILLMIGVLNLIFVFRGDVLQEYAVVGFILFALRKVPTQAMLVAGIFLAILAQPLWDGGVSLLTPENGGDSEAADGFASTGYWSWVALVWPEHVRGVVLSGALIGWYLYILGRFMIGAWVMREGLLDGLQGRLPAVRRIFLLALGAGVGGEFVSLLGYEGMIALPAWAVVLLHSVFAPILAIGYAAGLILLFYHERARRFVLLFAPVGRIALTAYVLHGGVFTYLFLPFGAGLTGVISPLGGALIAIGLYGAVTLFASAWLARFRYGPLEYLWRWGTYGQRPSFKARPKRAMA